MVVNLFGNDYGEERPCEEMTVEKWIGPEAGRRIWLLLVKDMSVFQAQRMEGERDLSGKNKYCKQAKQSIIPRQRIEENYGMRKRSLEFPKEEEAKMPKKMCRKQNDNNANSGPAVGVATMKLC